LVLTYDVQLVIFGGGVARAGTAFLDPVLQDVKRQRQESDLAREMLHPEMVQLLPPDFEAPLWGGIALAEEGPGKRQENMNNLYRR
jgi:predicted NBD/HSP70 family sugar kinase